MFKEILIQVKKKTETEMWTENWIYNLSFFLLVVIYIATLTTMILQFPSSAIVIRISVGCAIMFTSILFSGT